MKKIIFILISVLLISCKSYKNKQFSQEALNAPMINISGNKDSLQNIIKNYNGKTTIIDVWASWCGDCIKGLPKLKKLQEEHPEVNYIFISLDKNETAWKNGIKRYRIKGNHYYVNGGWKSIFAENINLDWIPRYIVIDETGKVVIYRAIKADDSRILKLLKN